MLNQLRLPSTDGSPVDIDWAEATGHFLGDRIRRVGLAGFEPATTAYLLAAWERIKPGASFFDVGANVGVYSMLAARLFPRMPVYAIEPVPELAATLRRLATRNRLDVVVEEWAASGSDGVGSLYVGERDNVSSLSEGWRSSRCAIDVPLRTIDAAVAGGLPAPGVVKIDVETHEPEVLDGMSEMLSRHRPVIVIELLRKRGPQGRGLMPSSARAKELLRAHGYVPFRIPRADLPRSAPDRDTAWFPDSVPDGFDTASRAWLVRVARCTGESQH
jgi:FkbM family methyltransferase